MQIKEYMIRKQAAEFLGVSGNTLIAWEKRGKLKCYRHPMSNYRLYKIVDLEEILKSINELFKA